MSNLFFSSISDEEFISQFYNSRIYVGKGGKIADALNIFLDNIQSTLANLGSSIRGDLFVFKNGVACKESVFFDETSDQVLWDKIWEMHMTEGATIYLRALQRHISSIKTILHEIKTLLPDRIPFANIFITPKMSVGLNPHFDPTEFIVYQLYGEKQWDTWTPPSLAEAEKMMPEEMEQYCKALLDSPQNKSAYHLKNGMAMYLPLYHVHAPHTLDRASCHITIGLADPTSSRLNN